MKMNMYVTKNLLSGLSDGIFLYRTDKLASVEIAEMLVKGRRMVLEEFQLNRVGTFDNETNEVVPSASFDIIPWDCRRMVEPKIDAPVKDVEENISQLQ